MELGPVADPAAAGGSPGVQDVALGVDFSRRFARMFRNSSNSGEGSSWLRLTGYK